jgi:hypothetical protein
MDTSKKHNQKGFLALRLEGENFSKEEITDDEEKQNLADIKELLLRDYEPVQKVEHSTDFATTEEMWRGMRNVIPKIRIMQVRTVLKECGFRVENLGEFDYKWLLRLRSATED